DLPDNLTGWKVLAMAVTPGDRMGLGEGRFSSNRPTEIRPVMPNQVTEDDRFTAGFSVMNRTSTERQGKVSVKVAGDGDAGDQGVAHEKTLKLGPYKKDIFWFPVKAATVKASRDRPQGELTFDVTAEDATDGDRLSHKVPVNKLRSLLTAANYGTTTEGKVEE